VLLLQHSALTSGAHWQVDPVARTVMVTTGEHPVTDWAWAVPDDTTWTTGVVHATTPAAAAAFLKALRRSTD
jgi:hypothetical protein